jgi:tetratricopeptide (TPR) repeat protein
MEIIMTKYAILGFIWLCAVSSGISAVTALPASAIDNMQSADAPDLTSVRAKIEAKDYAAALSELRGLAEDNQQADVYNLMGYTLRKTGDYRTSLTYYTKALELRPDYKAAREYLGELYIETGEMAKAEEQVSSLKQLCPSGCEELEDLQKAIAVKARD